MHHHKATSTQIRFLQSFRTTSILTVILSHLNVYKIERMQNKLKTKTSKIFTSVEQSMVGIVDARVT